MALGVPAVVKQLGQWYGGRSGLGDGTPGFWLQLCLSITHGLGKLLFWVSVSFPVSEVSGLGDLV